MATSAEQLAPEADDPRLESARLERLLQEVQSLAGPETWPRVEQLVQRLVTLYGTALSKLHGYSMAAGAVKDRLRALIEEDELVAGLLALQDDPSGERPTGTLIPLKLPPPPERDEKTRCELCGAPIVENHAHVAELKERRLACACHACEVLFRQPGSAAGRFMTVPTRVMHDPSLVFGEADWRALDVPVRLAFFFFSSAANGWTALYPGPAGTTEAELTNESIAALAQRTRLIEAAQHDVEALFAWTPRGQPRAHVFLVPITACYELSARLRQSWTGFSGGDEAQQEIETFLATTRERSEPVAPAGDEP